MKWLWLAALVIALSSFGLIHVAAFLAVAWVVLALLSCG